VQKRAKQCLDEQRAAERRGVPAARWRLKLAGNVDQT
jgi:hypothetical protein